MMYWVVGSWICRNFWNISCHYHADMTSIDCRILWVNIFVFIIAFVIWYLMKIFGIRIGDEAEKLGTDKAEVGVMAYSIRD